MLIDIKIHLKNLKNTLYEIIYKNIIDEEDPNFGILGIICEDAYIKTCLNEKEKKIKKFNKSEYLTPKKKKVPFDNQATIFVRSPNSGKVINIKLFKNGRVQMTGLKNENDGIEAIQFLVDYLKQFDNILIADLDNIQIANYRIVNINNTFNLFMKIDRKNLYDILIQNTNLYISHDRQRSPGILIYYKFNCNNKLKDGLCHCIDDLKCKGKGCNGTCKNVTIIIYESGKGTVTGANSMVQAIEAYEFIKNIILQNRTNIVKLCVDDIQISEKELNALSIIKKKKKKVLVPEEIIE
jgi:TATA-box binding protein (TBP) (component of TFIID and TFIIIB)